MNLTEAQWSEGLQISEIPAAQLYAEACAAFETAEIDVPMFSSDPFSRLLRYLREELIPRIANRRAEFERLVAENVEAIRSMLADRRDAFATYVGSMRDEGLAGPQTARLVILFATADALQKIVLGGQASPFANWTNSDWLMVSLAYLRLRDDVDPPAR